MKVVHKKPETQQEDGDWLSRAKKLELEGDLDKAILAFEKVIRISPVNEYAYDRLMIIYRKKKDYKKEKAVIVEGINAFQQLYNKPGKAAITSKVRSISYQLLKITGLADKKGRPLFEKEPLARWNKRKKVVEKNLKK